MAEYIGQPVQPEPVEFSPEGFPFQPSDGPDCRADFIELEGSYFASEGRAEEQLNALYKDILNARDTQFLGFIGNRDFINWVMTYGGGENDDGIIFFPEQVAQWLDANTATNGPIETVEQLAQVMDAIFYARAEINLEVYAQASIAYFPTPESCSEETSLEFDWLNEGLADSIISGIKLSNQERFLTDVADWLS